jgi:4-amino-4-deoxy-L-arabinose transferase-like glycosyltransferase
MEETFDNSKEKWLYLFIGLAVFINFSGLFVTIIGPDGALYASIAKNMVVNHNYSDLFAEGKDWLDKPHFPFWIAAFSFKLFGISTWAYKLPAILFVLMAAWYTYKLALVLYSKEVALWSALMLLTAQHIILSNMDVRAEPYLTGLIIGSVYYFYKAQGANWFWPLFLGAAFAACAVMTKGIFALIPVFGAIVLELIIKKQWSMLFNIRWLLAFILVAILIIPELWSLYTQFDLHPEKVVFGKTHVSGLKFFFWDSQFGRFFNSGPIKKSNGDPFFFLHTILWAFLPWSWLFYVSIVSFFRKYTRHPRQAEWLCIGGAGLTFLIFSASKFQLPHYITIIFPFLAILTAQYICSLKTEKTFKILSNIQGVIGFLMCLLIVVLNYFFQPHISLVAIVLMIVVVLVLNLTVFLIKDKFQVFYRTVVLVVFVNIYLNLIFYPNITSYQSDSQAAFWLNKINTHHLPVVKVVNTYFYAIDFYANQPVHDFRPGEEHLLPAKPYLLFAESAQIDQMIKDGVKMIPLKTFQTFPITRLKAKFLNYTTRSELLKTSQLVLIK